jgi:hypothetical protein
MREIKLTQLQRKILEYISDHPFSMAIDILEHIFDDDTSMQSKMYYNLDVLKKKKLIKSVPLKKTWGASSPSFLYLLFKGSQLLGRNHIPVTFRDYSFDAFLMKRAKLELTSLCRKNEWPMFEKDSDSQGAIVYFLKQLDEDRKEVVQEGYVYSRRVPISISPDIVIYTGGEVLIVVIVRLQAKMVAFKKRIEKYKELLDEVKLLFIVSNQDQEAECLKVLNMRQLNFGLASSIRSAKGIKVITPDKLYETENWLE